MRPILPLLLLTACARTSTRETVVELTFDPDCIDAVYRAAESERWLPLSERWSTCSLPGPDRVIHFDALRRAARGEPAGGDAARVQSPELARTSISLPRPDRGREWTIDVLGVNITRLDDLPAIRVETRFGDYGGMDRVVAWLEACGGRRVR